MKALVLKEPNRFVYEDVPPPEFGDTDVLIEVRACGICGSDVHGMDGSTGRRQPPIIMGHEASGVVAGVGRGVTEWKQGDRVTFDSTIYCGECWYCRRGEINLCDRRRVLGVSCDDYRQHGAFADNVAVPERILYRLPDDISYEQASMVEALSIAVHAVGISPLCLNDVAVVLGSGMIGLLVVQVLRTAGCGTIIAVDIDSRKLDLAQKLGANTAFNSKECNVPEEVKKLTDGRGADLAFEVVGISETVKAGVESLRKGGNLTLVGNLSPSVEFPLQSVVTRQIEVRGSCASCGEYPTCLDLIAKKRVDVDPLISAIAPLHEGGLWFQRLYEKEQDLMKVILRPQEKA